MTIDRIIALLASIGACLSAVATFLTVQQMAKQRRDSYRPDLALSQIPVHGTHDSNSKSPLLSIWTAKPELASTAPRFFTIPLLNLGLGAAKNSLVLWSFEIDDAVNMANDLAQRTLTPVQLTNEHGTLWVKSELWGVNEFIVWKNTQHETIDYVLPTAVRDVPVQLEVPLVYIAVITILLHLQFKLAQPGEWYTPKLMCDFKYSDIANRNHKSSYCINFHLSSLNKNEFFALLEPKRSS